MFRPPQRSRTLQAALRDLGDRKATVKVSALQDLVTAVDESGDSVTEARASAVSGAERCLRDEEPKVRAAAALALADLGAKDALPGLLVAIEDDDPHVRQMALTALGEIGDVRARERVRRALSDDRPEVRFQAVIAFPRVAPDEAWSLLGRALEDPDAGIRHIALRCAEEHHEKTGKAYPSELLDAARRLLEDADAQVRVASVIILGPDAGEAGHHVIAELIAGRISTHDEEDLAAAIELAGANGWTDVAVDLERRAFGLLGLRSGNIAWHARVALARLGNERAEASILRDLRSRSRDRRTFAVAAVGRARLRAARAILEGMKGRAEQADEHAVVEALALLGSVEK